jgi:hypothetical protein
MLLSSVSVHLIHFAGFISSVSFHLVHDLMLVGVQQVGHIHPQFLVDLITEVSQKAAGAGTCILDYFFL